MIVEIIKDLQSFFLVLIFLIFGFSLIFTQFIETQPYNTILLNTYILMFGQPDPAQLSPESVLFFIIITVMLAVILLNMIIAVMNNTFNNVEQSRVTFETKEKASLIREGIVTKRRIRGIFCPKRLRRKDNSTPKYLFVLEESSDEKNSLKSQLETQINSMKVELFRSIYVQKKIEDRQKVIEDKLTHIEEGFKSMNASLGAFLEKTNEAIVAQEIEKHSRAKNLPR